MISLKKYLDADTALPSTSEPDPVELLSATLESYTSALLAMGKNGFRACPALGSELQEGLAGLGRRLSKKISPSLVRENGKHVEEQLQVWGGRTAEYFKAKTNDVKEILIAMARTAESIGERDQRYSKQLTDFTNQLQTIANLDDLAQMRKSLVHRATELKKCVDQMAQDSHKSVAKLREEVSTYETKLKTVEQLASRDPLTGLANRRGVEERIEWRITNEHVFCIVILDLDRFKQVNDVHGHVAGDCLLKQFAQELKSNVRPNDIVGRWGGDEFILVLDCDLSGARSQIERMRKWVCGDYTIKTVPGAPDIRINLDVSVGAAQWQAGETAVQLTQRADASMYREKELSRTR
ncbi:MAG: GGDEF domain-containing protein [Terriglobales bacterium]